MLSIHDRGFWFRIDGLDPHEPHESLNPLSIDRVALADQTGGHPTGAIERCLRVLFVDQTHELEVEGCFPHRFVVQRRPADAEQLALADNRQFVVLWLYP